MLIIKKKLGGKIYEETETIFKTIFTTIFNDGN